MEEAEAEGVEDELAAVNEKSLGYGEVLYATFVTTILDRVALTWRPSSKFHAKCLPKDFSLILASSSSPLKTRKKPTF